MKQIHSFMRFWTITGLIMMCASSIKAQVASSLNSFITDNIYGLYLLYLRKKINL